MQFFYWPGMRRHVEEYVKNCHVCQRKMQASRSKLLIEIRETHHAPRLGNLIANLRTAHKLAKENGRKFHAANKRNDPVKWQTTKQEKTRRNARPKRRQPKEQEDRETSSGPIIYVPQVENPRPELRSPVMNRQALDTLRRCQHPRSTRGRTRRLSATKY